MPAAPSWVLRPCPAMPLVTLPPAGTHLRTQLLKATALHRGTGCKAEHWALSFHRSTEASFPKFVWNSHNCNIAGLRNPQGSSGCCAVHRLRQSPLPPWGSHTLHPALGLRACSTHSLHGKQLLTDDERKAICPCREKEEGEECHPVLPTAIGAAFTQAAERGGGHSDSTRDPIHKAECCSTHPCTWHASVPTHLAQQHQELPRRCPGQLKKGNQLNAPHLGTTHSG